MNETDCADYRGHGRGLGMRNNAKDTDLPGRIDGRGDSAMPAATAAASAASDTGLSGWIDDTGGLALPRSSTSAATAAGS